MKRTLAIVLVLLICGLVVAAVEETSATDKGKEEQPSYGRTPDEYVPYGDFTEPYKRFFMDPLEYPGYGRHIPEPEHVDSVKVGFLGPIEPTVSVATGGASHEEPLGRKMLEGSRLAVEHANSRGGYRDSGVPYELIVHNDNGLWGASGNEIIDLAYKEKVWAILGTIDGANSHIAIRVALKAEIPMVNSGDTDPTFIETNIPWVFRVITDDRQMCYLLADYVFKKLGLTRVAALRANNRYGRISIDEFRDAATRLGYPFLAELNYPVGGDDFTPQLKRIKSLQPEAVITYGDARESALILKQMREMGMDQWLIGSDRMVSPELFEIAGPAIERVVAGYPFDPERRDARFVQFQQQFKERFGEDAEAYAAHAYDGMAMIIAAIEEAGLNRAKIRDALAAMKRFDGVTGVKEFDPIFNNISPPTLAVVEKGRFVFYNREEIFPEAE
jgi:ABC-type branched-subunit amino acid transport system substrate-binding protein